MSDDRSLEWIRTVSAGGLTGRPQIVHVQFAQGEWGVTVVPASNSGKALGSGAGPRLEDAVRACELNMRERGHARLAFS